MKKTTVIIALLIFPMAVFAESFPVFPMALWGSATINNSSAPVGSVIRAYSNNLLVGQVIVQETGIYGYTDTVKQKLLVATNASGSIAFSIQHSSLNNGAEIFSTQTEPFIAASTVNKNLSFTFTVPPSGGGGGGGGGSGGGGGGGGSSSSNPTPNPITSSQGDSNGDGKTDLLDFNMLMVNWGKNETNNPADFNKDGIVDIFDFNLLMVNWTG